MTVAQGIRCPTVCRVIKALETRMPLLSNYETIQPNKICEEIVVLIHYAHECLTLMMMDDA